MAEVTKVPFGTEVGRGPGNTVLDGTQLLPKKGHNPHFSANVYCGQTAGWIKMPLGMEVGLSPGHIMFMETQLPSKGAQPSP